MVYMNKQVMYSNVLTWFLNMSRDMNLKKKRRDSGSSENEVSTVPTVVQ